MLVNVSCPECGCVHEIDERASYYTCPDCETRLEKCELCGEWVDTDTITVPADGKHICETCLEDDYFWCEHCEDYHPDHERNTVHTSWRDTEQWCDDCCGNYAVRCDHCEEYYTSDLTTEVDDWTTVCDGCLEDNYYWCDCCERYVHCDDWDYDDECCYDCASEYGVSGYHDHHGDWSPYGQPEGEYSGWIGTELEIDRDDPDRYTQRDLIDALEHYAGGHIYYEKDGSLRNGFEIITQPHTPEEFWKIDWSGIMSACRARDYKSHDTTTCGLHLHVSRTFFGTTEEEQDENIAKIIHFIDGHFSEVLKVSRRRMSEAQQWAAPYNTNTPTTQERAEELAKAKYLAGRYHAVNVTNTKTLEYRIMRGTLNAVTFRACIDFLLTLTHNAPRIAWENVNSAAEWLDGCEPETLDYIHERGAFLCV